MDGPTPSIRWHRQCKVSWQEVTMRPLLFTLPLSLVACELLPVDTTTDSGLDSGLVSTTDDDGGNGGNGGGRPGDDDDDAQGGGAGWQFSSHPCFGNRTDATWFDDRDTVWVGCGSTTDGKGLFRSDDGGATWASAGTWFTQFRVSSIQRADDGLLYVAGIDTTSPLRVVTLADDGTVTQVLSAGDQVWNSFHVGSFRRNSAGLMVAESLTGTQLLTSDDGAPFQDAGQWWGGGSESFQVLDLVLHDDAFYGVGSTISQPPYVYLPPAGGQTADAFGFEIMELSSGPAPFDGELYGIAVDGSGLVVGGVDQDHDVGWVFWTGSDPWAGVAGLEVTSFLGAGEPTWVRGVCRDGATMVAVGEYSRKGTGFVLRTTDGGSTWTDLTPGELPPVSKCTLFDDGELVVTGAEGLFAALR
jgi:photosystem II stability/assembly factor-like uncharacterized protein